MKKRTLSAVTFYLACCLSMPIRANAGGAPPALASADWSVNGTRNLVSNPPSLDAVQDFYDRAFGDEEPFVKVCEFRFADLRNSGNLSLITTVNPEGRQWPECNQLYIFDRTPRGFELYSADRAYGHDLANSVLDINHDGKHELVLWGPLAPVATGPFNRNGLGCDAEWPLVFAWTGNGYSEASDQYKDYYWNYLKSLEAQIAAYSSESGPAAAQTANAAPAVDSVLAGRSAIAHGNSASVEGPATVTGGVLIAPATTPEAASTPEGAPTLPNPGDYACTRIEAAKTEAFLGINSDSTMTAAIKDSESADPNKRILAAAIFSYLGSQEAEADLKTLSNDADSRVADIAKGAASFGEDPAQYSRRMIPGGASFRW
jgi:hypothetical protein